MRPNDHVSSANFYIRLISTECVSLLRPMECGGEATTEMSRRPLIGGPREAKMGPLSAARVQMPRVYGKSSVMKKRVREASAYEVGII